MLSHFLVFILNLLLLSFVFKLLSSELKFPNIYLTSKDIFTFPSLGIRSSHYLCPSLLSPSSSCCVLVHCSLTLLYELPLSFVFKISLLRAEVSRVIVSPIEIIFTFPSLGIRIGSKFSSLFLSFHAEFCCSFTFLCISWILFFSQGFYSLLSQNVSPES